MNKYTLASDFVEDAQFILDNSDLLIKSDCMIVDNILYENCDDCYRFFFSCDDYDYLEDADTIKKLNILFKR